MIFKKETNNEYERKKNEKIQADKEAKRADYTPYERTSEQAKQEIANQSARDLQPTRQEGRTEFQNYAAQPHQGLNAAHKASLIGAGRDRLAQQAASAHEQALSRQGQRGVMGGAAFAQKAAINKSHRDEEREVTRDVENLDQDVARQNMAAGWLAGEGRSAERASCYRQAGGSPDQRRAAPCI